MQVSSSKRFMTLVIGLALSVLAAVPALAQDDDVFNVAVGTAVRSVEPTTVTGIPANILDGVIQTLVTTDESGEIVPLLAESWEISEDGKSVTFNLREGVTFHDGTPFTAEAVQFSLDRWNDPTVRTPNPFHNRLFANLEVIDELTLRIDTDLSAQTLIFSLPFTSYGVISPDSVDNEELGNTTGEEGAYVHPIGTGPYEFTSLTPEGLTMTRYADYWGDAPYYETVVYQFVPQAATRESLLLAGQVEMILLPPVADIPSLQENPDVEVLLSPPGRVIYAAFNTQDEVLQDPRVRQALNYAVDKQAITDSLLFGIAQPATSVVPSGYEGYCEVEMYEYNPDLARELLAEAGVENLQIEFMSPTGRYLQDFQVAQAIAGYLAQVGVTAQPTTSDYGAYIGMLFRPPQAQTLDLHILSVNPPVPDAALGMFYNNHAEQSTPLGLNTAYYQSEEATALIDAALTATDEAERAQALCDAQQVIVQDAPWLYLYEQQFPIAYQTGLEGISILSGEKFNAIYARPAGE